MIEKYKTQIAIIIGSLIIAFAIYSSNSNGGKKAIHLEMYKNCLLENDYPIEFDKSVRKLIKKICSD